MIVGRMRATALAICLTFMLASALVSQEHDDDTANSNEDVLSIDGLWSGSWGGGGSDGVFSQPVMAEMVVDGDRIEMFGFRSTGRTSGTVILDASAREMLITPDTQGDGMPVPDAIRFTFEHNGEEITLVDKDGISVSLNRVAIANVSNANVQVEFLATRGINESGDLLVTGFRELQVGQNATRYFKSDERILKTKEAIVLLVQESECKKVTVDEARTLIENLSTVAVAWHEENRPLRKQFHSLWKDEGTPSPDYESVWQTFATNLRPGTLVFVLSAAENIPNP